MSLSHALLLLTYRCMLSCHFCLVTTTYWRPDETVPLPAARAMREMTTVEIAERVIPQCIQSGIKVIALSGGEVLLRRDIVDIFTALGNSPLRWCLDSTLIPCTDRLAEAIVLSSCDAVFVSLDGPREVHNRLRGSSTAFDAGLAGIYRLQRARSQAATGRPQVSVNCVIQPGNESTLPAVVFLAADNGADEVAFQLLSAREYEPFQAELSARSLEDARHAADALGLPCRVYPLSHPSTRQLTTWFRSPTSDEFFRECPYLLESVRIDPAGNVMPCIEHSFGNILDEDLSHILQGVRRSIFIRQIASGRRVEACRRCCNMSAGD